MRNNILFYKLQQLQSKLDVKSKFINIDQICLTHYYQFGISSIRLKYYTGNQY